MSEKLLGNCKTGLLFVISAPAGTGKTTLVQMLVKEFPCIVESISYTTRPRRFNEIDGEHYHFVDSSQFERMIAEGAFLEYVTLYGNYYGTAFATVSEKQKNGKHVVLVIDTQGALQLMKKLEAVFIFLKPPSLEILRQRLNARQTETLEIISERLLWAEKEMLEAVHYDYCIVNEDLSIAYQVLRSIFIAEEHRYVPQK